MGHEFFRSHKHTDEPWLLHLLDQLSTKLWVALWLLTIFLSALIYWSASHYFDGHGLVCTMNKEMDTPVSFLTSLYFSCVTTTTLGYGDFAPEGISRAIAIFQAFLGMAVVGAVISKVLTHHQGQTIAETNLIAIAEQSASVFTALNEQLVEFQEISQSGEHVGHDEAGHEGLMRRRTNVELRFNFLLGTIQTLLRKREIAVATKQEILKALGNTVVEFNAANKACDFPVDSTKSISQLFSICESTDILSELPKNQSIEEILKCLGSVAYPV